MLRIEHQRAGIRAVKFGSDPGIFAGQHRDPIPGDEPSRKVQLGGANLGTIAISAARPARSGLNPAVYGENDGAETGAGNALDRAICAVRKGEGATVSTAPLCPTLYRRRYRTVGARR